MTTLTTSLDGLLWTLVLVGVAAFVIVEAAVALVAFRRRPVAEAPAVRRPSRLLEAVWMLTPAVLLFGLVGWSSRVLGHDVGIPNGEPEVTVHVTGRGFAWEVAYEVPGPDGTPVLVDAGYNRVHLPVGRAARIVLHSADRVHGFWVPQLRLKSDAVPGQETVVRVRPLEAGEFNIVCATLCGDQHYAMRGFVHVESPEAFAAWLAEQRTP